MKTAKRKKLPVDELLRLACVYAERDQDAYADATRDCPDDKEFRDHAVAFVEQIREYRLRRWGQTRLEKVMEELVPVSIHEVTGRMDNPGKFPE